MDKRWHRTMMAREAVVLCGLAVALVGIGCVAPGGPDEAAKAGGPSQPKRITAAIRSDPPDLNAAPAVAQGATEVKGLLNRGLTAIDTGGTRHPQLAAAVPTTENGLWTLFPDGRMETTWNIRPNAQWHDGAPFTADDLLFTAMVEQDKEVNLGTSVAYSFVESIQALDPLTITIRWKQPYLGADGMFEDPMAQHLLRQPYEQDKASFAGLAYWSVEFVGTGPFRLREWVQGSHLILDAHERYVLGRPKIDMIEVRFIPDENTMMANLLAGAVDLTVGRGLSFESGNSARDQWREGKVVISYSGWIVMYPQFVNPNPPILADPRFRRALYHAIERQELVDTLMAGQTVVAHSYVDPTTPEHAEIEGRIVRYDYDPRKSAQILEELGYRKAADGAFLDATNQKLGLQIQTITPSLNQKATLAVADFWKRLGLDVETYVVPTAQQNQWESRANFPGFDLQRHPNNLDSALGDHLRSSRARWSGNNYQLAGGNNNMARLMDPQWDALLDRYVTTIPFRGRMQALADMIHWETRDLLVMGLFYDVEVGLQANRLENVTGARASVWNAHEWDTRA